MGVCPKTKVYKGCQEGQGEITFSVWRSLRESVPKNSQREVVRVGKIRSGIIDILALLKYIT